MQSNRRKFLSAVAGVGATLAVAGCSGTDEGTPTESESMTEGSMDNESMTEGEMTEGESMTEDSMDDGESMMESSMNESMTDSMN